VISVGRTARLAANQPTLAKADLGEEGIGIRVNNKDLYLVGGSKGGTLYAVFAFLEEDVGFRWFPKDVYFIPPAGTLSSLSVVNRTFLPPFHERNPYFYEVTSDRNWLFRSKVRPSNGLFDELGGDPLTYAPGLSTPFPRWCLPAISPAIRNILP
jgi:hypothetical protein